MKKVSKCKEINLLEYELMQKVELDDKIVFHLSTIKKPTDCKFCNRKTIRKYRKRKQIYLDIPHKSKRISLLIETQSYLCKECNKSFREELPKINKIRRMTNRLLEYIEKESIERPSTHIAKEIGCSEGTIRKIVKAKNFVEVG